MVRPSAYFACVVLATCSLAKPLATSSKSTTSIKVNAYTASSTSTSTATTKATSISSTSSKVTAYSSSASTSNNLPTATALCTNYNLTYKLTNITGPVRGYGSPASGVKVWNLTVDDTATGYKQNITGFGAAVTDATVSTFNSLSSSTLQTLLGTLMTSSGASFSMMRHTIGSSDMTPDGGQYTYDDNNGKPDNSTLPNFSLGTQGTAMANLLASMKTVNPNLKILGTPWSPPGFMKENGAIMNNATGNNLSDRYLNPNETDYTVHYGNYFAKYVQAYEKLGAHVDAITLQNEPLYSTAGYPSMYMYDYEQAQLIKNFVGPALASTGLGTSIWAHDCNTDTPSYPQTVLNVASNYTNTVAWHCYAGSLNWTAMTTFQQQNPGVQQYMTECWTPPVENQWNWFQAANFTIGPLQNWGSGVMAWTLGANSTYGPSMSGGCQQCRGLVTINSPTSYTLNIAYYLMAHFSRYMPRNARVLNGTGDSSSTAIAGIQHVATLNPDGTRSVVILSTLSADTFVTLSFGSGKTWSGTVPLQSLVTWIIPSN